MSIPLNIPIARDLIEATGQSYPLLALRSRGGFQPYDLKNALNGVTKGLTWAKLEALARVLRCDPEALVDPDYLRLINAPMNVALRFQNLYRRSRTQIYTFYQALFQGLLSSENFARILNSSADLYLILTATEENCTMEDRLGQALESICRRYQEGTGGVLCGSGNCPRATGLASSTNRAQRGTFTQPTDYATFLLFGLPFGLGLCIRVCCLGAPGFDDQGDTRADTVSCPFDPAGTSQDATRGILGQQWGSGRW